MSRIATIGPQLIPFAATCGLMLASVAVSLLALWRARMVLRAARSNLDDTDPGYAAAIELLRQELQALQKQTQDARQYRVRIGRYGAESRTRRGPSGA